MGKMADRAYEATILSAYEFKTRGAHGTYEKALKSLMGSKAIREAEMDTAEAGELFQATLKVVDDSLEFEATQFGSNLAGTGEPTWLSKVQITELGRKMEKFLLDRHPSVPTIFITKSISRIYYRYHLS